jgi:tRNA threonylcarbamoyladenosine biosynthesis protein TsaE
MKENYLIIHKKDAIRIAKQYAKLFKPGDVIALYGNLGVGKTFFVQNVCKAMGIKDEVSSPSYVLLNQYQGEILVNHYDLYRLQFADEVYELGMFEHLDRTLVFIEWPEIAIELLPEKTWHFHFDYQENMTRSLIVEHLD